MKFKIKSAEIVATAADFATLPAPDPALPEIAFLGRSNVGKSSLLNRLVNRKQLARTSNTPGKTRLIHMYEIGIAGERIRFVDLPGYGYAKVARTERNQWKRMIEAYLSQRPGLRAAILLQDMRRDVTDDETLLLDWLDEQAIPSLVAITKIDKLKPMRRAQRIKVVKSQLLIAPSRAIPTSSEKGDGIEQLWKAILERLRDDD
jgi:GTP-binding protein